MGIKEWPAKIMHILREYRRVIIVSRKPTVEELSKISKIAGIGILIVGLIGFGIQTIFKLILG
ncbi:MAG TPA: protein translocase SEC61 complex subunit gamma [Candidatus Woesearchaeota archaeon]|nr:protein translocase SEC61 complex subunit gamma [Candidatus Woesearchaeota archaeon]